MQSSLGADLGDVRVHTGARAEAVLDELGGDAVAVGRHLAIRPQASHASTLPGRVLLLHEMMHVVQQTTDQPSSATEDAGNARERDAREAALALATKPPLPLGRVTTA